MFLEKTENRNGPFRIGGKLFRYTSIICLLDNFVIFQQLPLRSKLRPDIEIKVKFTKLYISTCNLRTTITVYEDIFSRYLYKLKVLCVSFGK